MRDQKERTSTAGPTFKYNFIQIWGLLYMYIYVYIYFFWQFLCWVGQFFFLQSLRPNIHTSVGTGWVNSKAAAVTTPSIPQQRDCLWNSLCLTRREEAGRLESQSEYCCKSERISKEQREGLLSSSQAKTCPCSYMRLALWHCVALIQTLVNVHLRRSHSGFHIFTIRRLM